MKQCVSSPFGVVCCSGKKMRILDAEGLALGSQIATSKKRARDLMDGSFHRCVSPLTLIRVPLWRLVSLSEEKSKVNDKTTAPQESIFFQRILISEAEIRSSVLLTWCFRYFRLQGW